MEVFRGLFMKIHEIFIMSKGGVTVFYRNFSSGTLDKDIFSGLMTALRTMAVHITGKELKELVISDHRYSIFSFDKFILVIHSGEDCCPTEIASLASEIGLVFESKYGKSLKKTHNLGLFDPFSQDLNIILSIESPKTEFKSSEVLTNFFGLTKGKINIKRVLENL